MSVSSPSDQIGRVLGGRYRVVAPIGRGASAEVFLADDTTLRRRVAVKMLHSALADDPVFLRRFRAEAQAAAALNHPHVMAVHDWGHDEVPYLVSEYLSGGSLRAMLDAGHRLTPSQTLLIGLEATRGLEYAHKRGLVHRDIKPANLLFDDEGRLRIADFGIARALAEAAWTEPTGAVVGTARYASPEQAKGENLDGRSDVYALALVLIESVTGEVPFTADTTLGTLNARVGKPLPVPDALGPLRKAIERAGDPDMEERPDAGGFSVALMAAAEELTRPEPLPLVGTLAVEPGSVADGGEPTMVGTVPVVDGGRGAIDAESPADEIPPDAEPSERRRRWPWILLASLVVAGAIAGGVVAFLANQTTTHEVPDLRGLTFEDAVAEAEDLGWTVAEPVNQIRDNEILKGSVISTAPAAGERLAEGEELIITVSSGPELIVAPSSEQVYDQTVEVVVTMLTDLNLAVGTEFEQFDEEVAAGSVLGLIHGGDPAEGVAFEPETPIDLLVSSGPSERTVPDLVGLTFAEAEAVLAEDRLVAVEGVGRSSEVEVGQVIETEPAVGTLVDADSEVTVLISEGRPLVVVPDLDGLTVDEAQEALLAAGLAIPRLTGPLDGVVVGQDPLDGVEIEEGTAIEIVTR